MVFPYNHQEPMSLTDLKNKLFANFYKFLTSSINFATQEYLNEYYPNGLLEDNLDIRVAEPKREANKIPYELAYEMANSTVNDIREAFNHFKVVTITNAPYSQQAPDPIQWGPALPY